MIIDDWMITVLLVKGLPCMNARSHVSSMTSGRDKIIIEAMYLC